MEAWIRSLLSLAPGVITSFATGVRDRILALYSWINTVLTGVFNAWGKLTSAVSRARDWVTWAIGEAYLTAKWTVQIRVPALIRAGVDNLRRALTALIDAAEVRLKATLTALDKWAKAAVAAVSKGLSDLRSWAITSVNSVRDKLTNVTAIVYALLTSPGRLAAWLVGAMIAEIWRYIDANVDRIFLWAQRRSVAYTVGAVKRIEQILGRLL